MNRPLIITIGITILLIVLGVWLYIFLFGTPEDTGEVFANLGFTPTSQPTTITPPEDSPTLDTLVDTSTGSLRQLTTRSVAGFMSTTTAAGKTIRYAERGTGYVFEIDLSTGVETLISRTTIPQVANAVFSNDATHVAFTSYIGYVANVYVGVIENNGIAGINLEPGASNLAFTNNNEVLYTIVRNGVTTGYRQNLVTETRVEQFTFNFTNLDVAWGDGQSATYITTKPASTLEGFMYQIDGDKVVPSVRSGLGLTSFVGSDAIIATYRRSSAYQSIAYNLNTNTENTLPVVALKEKCTFDTANPNFIWCAAPLGDIPAGFVDNWYKGTVQSDDRIWLIDTVNESARLVVSPYDVLGRTLDITATDADTTGQYLFFKNRTDQTLWLYDLKAQ